MMTRRRPHTRSQTQKIKASYATITDLPNELITNVLEQLTLPELYALSFLCRRLHVLAFSLYLRKRDLYTSNDTLIVSTDHHVNFKALRLALFITRLTALNCILYDINHARHLERLLSRMSHVLDVTVHFHLVGLSSSFPNPLSIFLTALENKSCHTISLTNKNPTFGPLIYSPTRNPRPLTTLTRCRLVGNSHALLQYPWLTWTTESLNGSPLTHLELKNCTQELVAALPSLSLPHLSWLSMENCYLYMSAFAPFLARHPTIRTLKLSSLYHDLQIKSIKTKLFPALTSLSCKTRTLNYLLAKPRAFPSLSEIHVLNLTHYEPPFIAKVLKSIRRTRASHLGISLMLPVSVPHKTWLASFREPEPSRARRKALAAIQLPLITTLTITIIVTVPRHRSKADDELLAVVDLPLWSPIFPSLNTVKIESVPSEYRLRPSVSRSRDRGLALVEGLVERWPQIRVVVVDGVGGTIEDWRDGKERVLEAAYRERSVGWSLRFS